MSYFFFMEHSQFRIENHRLLYLEAPFDTLRHLATDCKDLVTLGQLESVVYSAGSKNLAVVEVCKVSSEERTRKRNTPVFSAGHEFRILTTTL